MHNEEDYYYGATHCPKENSAKELYEKDETNYRKYCDSWLREQPFYRAGMNSVDVMNELDYLNKNLNDFYNGKYMPLWKQNIYNRWFK